MRYLTICAVLLLAACNTVEPTIDGKCVNPSYEVTTGKITCTATPSHYPTND